MSGLTIENPIKFGDLLTSSNVRAGDTLYLRGGTYTGDWVMGVAIKGTEQAPVTIKPYEGEPVTIDGSLQIFGDYVRIYDIDFTDSRANPQAITMGIYAVGLGFYLCGCSVRKMHASGVSWYGYGAGMVTENIIEDNGYQDVNGNNHGYCIYTHNDVGGEHFIERNLMIPRWEKYSLHLYSGGKNYLRDYRIRDNVFMGAVHTGGGYGLVDCQHERNIHNGAWTQLGRYMYDPLYANTGGTIKDNIFIDTITYSVNEDNALPWVDLVESGNVAWSPYRPGDFGNGYTVEPKPANWSRFIPFTVSARWSGIQVALDGDTFTAAMVTL